MSPFLTKGSNWASAAVPPEASLSLLKHVSPLFKPISHWWNYWHQISAWFHNMWFAFRSSVCLFSHGKRWTSSPAGVFPFLINSLNYHQGNFIIFMTDTFIIFTTIFTSKVSLYQSTELAVLSKCTSLYLLFFQQTNLTLSKLLHNRILTSDFMLLSIYVNFSSLI